jgi:16S rRNA (adenine1518-N6/adenine1519-N6)-dimethyltransferase
MTTPHTLLKAWNLRARKQFGQNFLKDQSVAHQIVSAAELSDQDVVLEIGAGLGAMTIAAARAAGQLIAVEKDRQLVPLLRSELLLNGLDRVDVYEQDILSFDINPIAAKAGRPLVVMGNLPYNISSQVVVKLIRERHALCRAVLMFQKELADRLCAPPGSRAYGRLSVMLQYCARIKALREVKADQFFPKPKVDSAVLRIDFKSKIVPAADNEAVLERVVQAAFGQRRKTLRNALAGGLTSLNSQTACQLLESAGIDPRRRAETMTVQEFVKLANVIGAACPVTDFPRPLPSDPPAY